MNGFQFAQQMEKHPRIAATASVSLLLVLLGGCMSGSSGNNGDVNEPLRRMSKKQAEKWARHFVESMARTAEVEIDPEKVNPAFTNCTGKGGETAEDGRFNLDYYAGAPLEPVKYERAVAAVRNELKKRSFKINAHEKTEGSSPSVILDATNVKDGFFVSVEGQHKDRGLLFTVSTPCLLPPGAEQEQF